MWGIENQFVNEVVIGRCVKMSRSGRVGRVPGSQEIMVITSCDTEELELRYRDCVLVVDVGVRSTLPCRISRAIDDAFPRVQSEAQPARAAARGRDRFSEKMATLFLRM